MANGGSKSSGLNPAGLIRAPGSPRDLELHWTLGLVLHDHSARGHLIAIAPVPLLLGLEGASPQLAVDAKIDECDFANAPIHGSRTRSAQMSLGLEGAVSLRDADSADLSRQEQPKRRVFTPLFSSITFTAPRKSLFLRCFLQPVTIEDHPLSA